jgi:hypothetical protein
MQVGHVQLVVQLHLLATLLLLLLLLSKHQKHQLLMSLLSAYLGKCLCCVLVR